MNETWNLNELTEAVPSEAAELLRQMGVEGADFSTLFSVRFSDVLRTIFGVAEDALQTPLAFLGAGLVVLLLLGAFGSMGNGSKWRDFVGGLCLITAGAVPLHNAVNMAVTAVKTVGALMCALIPILAAVVAASGNPVLSAVWQTAVFSAAETITAAASGFMVPCCGLVAGLGVFGVLTPQPDLSAVSGKIRKLCTGIFSAMATLFTAFLSLKGTLAGTADSLTAKGIKLALGTFIPVIGSQLGEAYSSVVGSLSAVRSTAAVFAIGAVCAVAIPAGVQMLLWMLSLKILELFATLLGQKNESRFFASMDSALSVLHSCLWFVTVLYVLALGILVKVRTGT